MRLQEAREPLTNERPTQTHDTAPQASAQEILVLEAVRKACFEVGIDHDVTEFVIQRGLDGLKKYGLVPNAPSYEDIIRSVDPECHIYTEYTVFSAPGGRSLAKAQEIAAAVVASASGPISLRLEKGLKYHWLDARIPDRKFAIFCDPREVAKGA